MLATFQSNANSLFKQYEFQIIAILASLVSSFIALSYHQPFNVDGIIYLNTATTFLHDGLRAAVDVYRWPFYPIIIALVSKITHLSLEKAAFLVNCTLNTITLITFVYLIKEFGGSRRVQYLGLLVILIYPYLNHDRDNILRDFGYYAFALLSLLFFMRYMRQLNWRYAFAWGTCILTATLFRIEGLVLLSLVPFVIFLQSNKTFSEKIRAWLKINLINIFCAGIAITWLLIKFFHQSLWNSQHLGLFKDYFSQFKPGFIIDGINNKNMILQQSILKALGTNSADGFLAGGIFGIFFESFINTIGLLYLFLSFYALYNRLIPFTRNNFLAWSAYLTVNLLIITTFLFSQFFLAERYLELLCLILIIGVPFSLETIYTNWREQKTCFITGRKWFFPVVCLFLLISAIDSIGHFGTSKAYITQAGKWIDKNTPANTRLLSNNAQLIYYSHRVDTKGIVQFPVNDDPLVILQNNKLSNYDYVALLIYPDQTNQEKQIKDLIKVPVLLSFQNRRGDKILIFKLSS